MLPQSIVVSDILANSDSFFNSLEQSKEPDVENLIYNSSIRELVEFSKDKSMFDRFVTILANKNALPTLQRKLNPSGSPFKPNERAKYAIVSMNNMRQRCVFQLILVGMIAYIYRALEERSAERFTFQFTDTFDESERKTIRRFLDGLFEYNPTEHIDRLSSEIYTPDQSKYKKVKSRTQQISINSKPTRIIDHNLKVKNGESKAKTVDRAVAEMTDINSGHTVTIDPPIDFMARFMNYYNAHFDGIYKTTFELFMEQRINAHSKLDPTDKRDDPPLFYREEVRMVAFDPANPDDESKTREIVTMRLPAPNLQWNFSAMIFSPESGKFYESVKDAEDAMMAIKNLAISDLKILPTNSVVQLESWAIGNKNVIVDDPYARAILQKHEDNAKLYSRLNKERAMKATLINMIENGPDRAEFEEYLSNLAPSGVKAQMLDEYEQEELMDRYREFMKNNKVYSNNDQNFMDYVARQLPSRDLTRRPLTIVERKKLSAQYRETVLMSEVTADDIMGLDIYELGGDDPDNPRCERRRDYVMGNETPLPTN